MFGRLSIYLKEMFPLQLYLPLAAITFFGLYFSAQKVMVGGPIMIGVEALIGCLTLFSFSLLMRIFDEFKDFEIDKVLFPHRPLVRGAVRARDLIKLGYFLVAAMCLANLYLGWVFVPFIATLAFGFLTFKWFFSKDLISNNLLLAFVTHQPMGILVNIYAVAIPVFAMSDIGSGLNDWFWFVIIALAYFFPVSAWETARKVRSPSQETDYVTYSKLLGPRWACSLALLFVVLSGVLFLFLFHKLGLPVWSLWLVFFLLAAYVAVCVRFMLVLSANSNIIRPAAEICLAAIQLLFLVLLVYKFGVKFL